MSIDREPWYAKRMTQHYVRGLAANTRQFREQIHVGRHLAAVLGDERLGHTDQGFGLLSKEAGGLDLLFERRLARGGERRRVRILCEQRRRHHVHPRIGRLRRQDRRDEQLERVAVVELRVRIGMLLGQCFDDAASDFLRFQWTGPLDQPTFE